MVLRDGYFLNGLCRYLIGTFIVSAEGFEIFVIPFCEES
jgi:hypothetical protein